MSAERPLGGSTIRTVLYTAYGVAVGAGYWALFYLVEPNTHVVALAFFGLALMAFSGFLGWGVAQEFSTVEGLLFLTFWPVVVLAGGAIMAVALSVYLPFWLTSLMIWRRRFRTRMKAKGRLLGAAELRRELEAGRGTLIEELGPYGYTWWTADDLLSMGAPQTDEEWDAIFGAGDHPFNDRVLRDYLDLEAGKALLTSRPPRRLRSAVPVVWALRPLSDYRGR